MNITITQDIKPFEGFPEYGHQQMSAYWTIPEVDFDKTYYYLDIRTVTACKIESIYLCYESQSSVSVCYILNTPMGKKIRKKSAELRFFESAEDCIQYTIGKAQPIYFKERNFKSLFPDECVEGWNNTFFDPTRNKCYYFSQRGGKVENTGMPMRFVIIDKSGLTIGIGKTRTNLCEKVYLSKEDCVREQINGIQIMDFAEDETEPCKVQKVSVSQKKREPRVVTLRFIEQ